jgi:periplasmic protein TonB
LPLPSPPPPQDAEPGRFQRFLAEPRERQHHNRRRRFLLTLSLVVHGLLLAVGVAGAYWQVDTLSGPTVAVTFLSIPPPPPPPPPPAATTPQRERVRRPRPVVQPSVTQPEPRPVEKPAEETDQSDEPEGDSGGVEGGVAGGVVGGVPAPQPPPQPTESQRRALLDRYLRELLRTRIAARFRYPPQAEREGAEGLVVVRVAIDAGGRLLDLRLVGVCPHAVLCEAASQTLLASAPFPPPPAELGASITVDVPLSYRLQ